MGFEVDSYAGAMKKPVPVDCCDDICVKCDILSQEIEFEADEHPKS
jgi:hypothetical protein